MREPSFQELLESSFSYYMSNIYTALPCVVLTVHNNLSGQRVDVQPCINRKLRDNTTLEHPPILNVPIIFPSSSTSAFTFPISVGDTVLCVFIQRSTDVFKSSQDGKPQTPVDTRRFDKKDAVAIPGFWPFAKAVNNPSRHTNSHSTNDTVIVHNLGTSNEVEVRLKQNGNLQINTTNNVIVNCETATVNATTSTFNGDVQVNGTVTVTEDVIADGISLVQHTHDVPNIQSGGTTRTSLEPN